MPNFRRKSSEAHPPEPEEGTARGPVPHSPSPPHAPAPSDGSPADIFPENSLDSTPISGSASKKPQGRISPRNLFMIQFSSLIWSFSFNISPSNEYSGLISFRTDWISLQSKGLSRVFSNTTVQKHQFFSTQLSLEFNSNIHI